MKNKNLINIFFVCLLCSCTPVKNEINTTIEDQKSCSKNIEKIDNEFPLGIIGEIEPIHIENMENPLFARIDSGADTSSIDAKNIKYFERDGKSWVKFEIVNRKTGERKLFKKRIKRKVRIKKNQKYDRRKVVLMNVKFGNLSLEREFTLTNRSQFEYQVLIGRNIISGIAIIDVSKSITLK